MLSDVSVRGLGNVESASDPNLKLQGLRLCSISIVGILLWFKVYSSIPLKGESLIRICLRPR